MKEIDICSYSTFKKKENPVIYMFITKKNEPVKVALTLKVL